jgi:hypothetical protein
MPHLCNKTNRRHRRRLTLSGIQYLAAIQGAVLAVD